MVVVEAGMAVVTGVVAVAATEVGVPFKILCVFAKLLTDIVYLGGGANAMPIHNRRW